MKKIFLIFIGFILINALSVYGFQVIGSGGVTGGAGASCPSDGSPDLEYDYANELNLGMAGDYTYQGFEYTPDSTRSICKIAFEVTSHGTPSNNTFYIQICDDASGDADDNCDAGEVLATSTGKTGQDALSQEFEVFAFSGNPELTGSHTYLVMIYGGDGTDYYSIYNGSAESNQIYALNTYNASGVRTNNLTSNDVSSQFYYYD